ncbi:radical SAM family heme chaperone HemW [Thorsellia anophelis]|uniref:Heme chaperone HemW n=1 Tax=Thorsellia anophelis DSM 18579 TaxID=1123402 RepID=A0A1H9YCW3_9GAMM|nr:radical SAM family heme chaperone HemW [Thorsellia anophelis]SES66792.1 coproporphyrinogen III oxidase, anaerobic [Thorsellia anophelis DSM 18579]
MTLKAHSNFTLAPLSLYVHIPWCVEKCPYCDFNSHALKTKLPQVEYIEHLLKDLEIDAKLVKGRQIQSIFIGGGTPSLLDGDVLDTLLKGIFARVEVSPSAEITMEANPNSVEALRFSNYQSSGVNRISIGVQSFNADKLIRLGRIHDPKEAINAAHIAKKLGLQSFNLDIMHGLPNQSTEEALNDIKQIIELDPPHFSWYQLTIEPNTNFASKPPKLPDDDILWDIYTQGNELLSQAGYVQYETSAYSKVGYQCQHNLNYWRFGDYLGIGCGAHGKITYLNGSIIRTQKTKHPKGYMESRYLDQSWQVPLEERPFEFFMNRFRLFEPVAKTEFEHYTFCELTSIEKAISDATSKGFIDTTDSHWQITSKGKLFLNDLLDLFL